MSLIPRPHLPLRVLSLTLIAALSPAAVALAQTPTDNPDSRDSRSASRGSSGDATLPAVTVSDTRVDGYVAPATNAATGLRLTPRETPQSMTVFTQERIEDQNVTNLRDLLDNTPGFYSNQYDTERVVFYSRGFMVDTLLFDGLPAARSFNTSSIDETIDTAFYQRVEIVRGATGLMTGAGNPAASVNLVRKHADSRSFTGSVDLSLSSWSGRRAVVDLSTPFTADGRIRGRLVAVGDDRKSYQNLYHKKRTGLYGIVDADLTTTTRLSVGIEDQSNRPRGNTWGSFPLFLSNGQQANWARSVTTATDWAYWTRKTQTAFAELRQELSGGWSTKVSLSRRRFREDMNLFYMAGYPDPVDGTGLMPFAYKSDGWTNENALDVSATGPFSAFGRQHELVLGYTGSWVKRRSYEYATEGELPDSGNFFAWDGSYPKPVFASTATPVSDIRNRQQGLYAATRLSITDQVKGIAGVRLARWKTDAMDIYSDPSNNQYNQNRTVPYAGLIYDFMPGASAFVSYTGIFNPQNSRDVNGRYLNPIMGRSAEIGLKGEHLGGALTSSLTLFNTRQDNVAAPAIDAATGQTIRLPDGSVASVAVEGTRSRGFELELTGRLNSEWQGSIGWTHYAIKDGDGERIQTFIPDKMVRLFTTWEPKRLVSGLKLGAGLNWQSATHMPMTTPDGQTQYRQGNVTLLSLMARYQVTSNVAVQLNAYNMLDKKYVVLDQYENSYYGAPANATLSLRVDF